MLKTIHYKNVKNNALPHFLCLKFKILIALDGSGIDSEQPVKKSRHNQSGLNQSCLIKTVDEYNTKSLFYLYMVHDNAPH